jgi:hypothetical protein
MHPTFRQRLGYQLICTHMKSVASRNPIQILQCVIVIAGATSACAATPCTDVDRRLTSQQKSAVAPEIAKQLKAKTVDVLQSFRSGGWSIFYVDTHESDEAYVFYARDPQHGGGYITLWSGAAREDEEQAIKAWTIKNVPGIPRNLASCFAWHVTKER